MGNFPDCKSMPGCFLKMPTTAPSHMLSSSMFLTLIPIGKWPMSCPFICKQMLIPKTMQWNWFSRSKLGLHFAHGGMCTWSPERGCEDMQLPWGNLAVRKPDHMVKSHRAKQTGRKPHPAGPYHLPATWVCGVDTQPGGAFQVPQVPGGSWLWPQASPQDRTAQLMPPQT